MPPQSTLLVTKKTKPNISKIIQDSVGVFLLFSSVFYMVNSPIVWDDSGGYHIGNIEWLSKYGMPYGIGLVHQRLAILSSWNTVIATLNHGLFEHRVFSITNGLVLFLLLLQIVVLLQRLSSKLIS